MARYRPIAPKPHPTTSNAVAGAAADVVDASPSSMSPTIRQSPYLRNVWPHLQSRPTRTRKRGRTSIGPPPATFKRPRTLLQGLSPPFRITTSPLPPVTLPLLPAFSSHNHMQTQPPNVIDLNKTAEIPEEKDLLAQLQNPITTNHVISPIPIRLIPSTVSIRSVKLLEESSSSSHVKKSEEIEKELESQVLPGFVSDSKNQVRLVNSSYKQMVGQPECAWVESMVTGEGVEVACRSICGKVVLNFMDLDDDDDELRGSGFSCWARIEWGVNGNMNLVNAYGEAMRLACESKDYRLAWRFHTRDNTSNL